MKTLNALRTELRNERTKSKAISKQLDFVRFVFLNAANECLTEHEDLDIVDILDLEDQLAEAIKRYEYYGPKEKKILKSWIEIWQEYVKETHPYVADRIDQIIRK